MVGVTPSTSTTEARNVNESRTNAGQATPATPTMSPAMAVPTTPAMTRVAWVTELAASSPASGTTRGISAPRAGVKNVPIDAWMKARTMSSGTRSARPTTTNPRTTIARRVSATSMIRRRSQRSA